MGIPGFAMPGTDRAMSGTESDAKYFAPAAQRAFRRSPAVQQAHQVLSERTVLLSPGTELVFWCTRRCSGTTSSLRQ
eukprot:2862612-Rhodomonas_salina.5